MKGIKTKLYILAIILTLSISAKSQTLESFSDTNIIFVDYNPDIVIYNSINIQSLKEREGLKYH